MKSDLLCRRCHVTENVLLVSPSFPFLLFRPHVLKAVIVTITVTITVIVSVTRSSSSQVSVSKQILESVNARNRYLDTITVHTFS